MIKKNKAGTQLYFTSDEKFSCPQCPASNPDFRGRMAHGAITLQCVADWCPLFAYYLEDADEVD